MRTYSGGAARRVASPSLLGLGELARRLTALEGQVESALGRAGDLGDAPTSLRSTVDGAVATYVRARRWVADQAAPYDVVAQGLDVLYRWWWRVDAHGLERIPRSGPVLVVTNRGGALLPYEVLMLAHAIDQSPARAARPMVDRCIWDLPVIGSALAGLGVRVATAATVRRVLEADEAAIVYPEGADAVGKSFSERYRVKRFGRGTLLGVAIEAGAPIVPVAVIGAEEAQPTLLRVPVLGRALGLPALPLTPTIIPLPTKWTVHVGEPLAVSAGGGRDTGVLQRVREQVRERLQGLVTEGVRRRRSLFFGA